MDPPDADSGRPPFRDARYRTLDLWRGVACLMIVVHHAGVVQWGGGLPSPGFEPWPRRLVLEFLRRMDQGVPLFFVISGYCIAASVESTRRKGEASWSFLRRRFRRIYPPYWAAMLWFLVVTGGLDSVGLGRLHRGPFGLELDSPSEFTLPQWVGNITLTETWRPQVWGRFSRIFTRVAWSLCYEEQFYFVCFLALLFLRRRAQAFLLGVTIATGALRVFAWDSGGLHRLVGTFPYLWHEFAVGAAVFWYLNLKISTPARVGILAAIFCLFVVACLHRIDSTITASAFGFVLIALRRWDDEASRLGLLAPLRACGKRSYSIYLFHLPICTVGNVWFYERGVTGFWPRTFVVVPLVSMAAVAVSWCFFAAVESHFLTRNQEKTPAA